MPSAFAFVGRSNEKRLLQQSLDPRGKGSHLALITGAPGVGKTRLVQEVLAGFEENATLLWFRADPLDQDQAFGALTDLRSLAERPDSYTQGSGAQQLADQFVAHLIDAAMQRPVIVIAEDFHWADLASWRVVRGVASAARHVPLSVVVVVRAAFANSGGSVLDRLRSYGATECSLQDFDEEEVRALSSQSPLNNESISAELLLRSGGNPLLVTEILRSIRHDRFAENSGVVQGSEGDQTSIPSSLRVAVLSRLNDLAPHERDLLGLASLLGVRFSVDELADIAGRNVVEVVSALNVALSAGVLVADRHELRFHHALVADCVREDQPVAIRQALHRHIARVLAGRGASALRVAEHYVLAATSGVTSGEDQGRADEDAARWLAQAAHESEQMSLAASIALMERAVRCTPQGTDLMARRVELASLYLLAGRLSEAERLCGELLAGAPSECVDDLEVASRGVLAAVLALRGPLAAGDAIREFDTVIALCGPGGQATADPAVVADSLAGKAIVLLYAGDPGQAETVARQAIAAAQACDNRSARSRAHEALALVALTRFDSKSAREHVAQSLAWFSPSNGRWSMLVTPHLTASLVHVAIGDIEAAISVCLEGLEICDRSGHLMPRLYLLPCLAVFHLIGGNLDEAVKVAALTNELIEDWCPTHPSPVTRALIGYVAWLRGDETTAVGGVEHALKEMWSSGAQVAIADLVAWLIASVYEGVGRTDEAYELLHVVWGLLGAATGAVVMAADLVRLSLVRDPSVADSVLSTLRDRALAAPTERNQLVAARAESLTSSNYAAMGPIVEQLELSGNVLMAAWAQKDAAAMAVEAGDAVVGEEAIRLAIRRFDAMNAPVACSELRAMARSIGITMRPSRSRRSSALTEVEELVAKLAVEGFTNREIGERLFISARTVESHLTHVFAKLGVKNRVQLSSSLRGGQPPS